MRPLLHTAFWNWYGRLMWSPVSAAERLTSELLAAGLGGASSYRAWGRGGKLRYGTVNTRMHARHKRETKRALNDGIHEHALPLPRKARGATCFVAAQAPSLGADTPCCHGNPLERGLLLFMRSILFDAASAMLTSAARKTRGAQRGIRGAHRAAPREAILGAQFQSLRSSFQSWCTDALL